ncbi:NYN domain-containing protein [Alloprevotella tannerae]|uniref:NYN domain-containing protein n=1 Tax=Alloprevotella tannerae TaxID=76122 RepID=UPI0028F0F4A3|nr:NYN domain-containing protein [Alloprevotella tannerae]
MTKENSLTRIGVFYDGNYFLHVSNYYSFSHERRSRLSIEGLHHFIRKQVSKEEGVDENLCQIVDAHYFRGRLTALEAKEKGQTLYYDRLFDDILSSEGVTTHYLPLKSKQGGGKQEKGIDVWLALEAFEQAFYKRFSVLVLVACDGDYVPLIRKLNALGTRVMVLSWDFEYTNDNGKSMMTRTSQELLEEVTYPIAMHEIIDNRVQKSDPLINGLFVPKSEIKPQVRSMNMSTQESEIVNIAKGYGFIKNTPENLFFYYLDVSDVDFNDLKVGDKVSFTIERGEKGKDVAKNVRPI